MAIFDKNKKHITEKKEKKATTFSAKSVFLPLMPHITEKASMHEEQNKYIFRVSVGATRGQIAEEFMERFGVRPLKVNIIQGRQKARRRGMFIGYKTGYKKAIITVPKDKKVDIVPK